MSEEPSIIKKIEELISKKISIPRFKLKIGEYHASMIGYCMRKLFYIYKSGDSYKVDEKRLRIFESGKIYHEWFSNILNELGFIIKEGRGEKVIDVDGEKIKLIGTFDDLVFLEAENGTNNRFIVEIKTTSSIRGIKEPNRMHVIQLNVYLNFMNIEKGIIFYIDRDSLETKGFIVQKDEKLFEETIKRVITLHKCLIENRLPTAEASLDIDRKWECEYCDFVEECYSKIREGKIFEEKP